MRRIFPNNIYKAILSVLLLSALCLCCVLSVNAVFALKAQCNEKTYLFSQSESLSGLEADKQQENDRLNKADAEVTLWGEKTSAVRSEVATLSNVPTVMVSGRTDLLFPEAITLMRGMKTKCLLGEETAGKLFGGSDVIGLTVHMGEKDFTVAGIVPNIGDVLVYETSSEEDIVMNHAVLQSVSFNKKPFAVTEYLSVHPEYTVLDYDLVVWILELLTLVIPMLIACSLIWSLGKDAGKRLGKKPLVTVIAVGFAVLLAVAVGIIATGFLDYPSDMIPSKWSDFAFWARLFSEKKSGLWLLIRQPLSAPDYLKFSAIVKLGAFTALSIILYIALRCVNALMKERKTVD